MTSMEVAVLVRSVRKKLTSSWQNSMCMYVKLMLQVYVCTGYICLIYVCIYVCVCNLSLFSMNILRVGYLFVCIQYFV